MEQVLVSALLQDPQMSALLGSRIHWMLAPQAETTCPFLVTSLISKMQDQNYQGITGLTESRVQFDVYADRFLDVCAITDALVHFLTLQRSGSGILGCFIQSSTDFFEDARGGSSRLYRRSTDAFIFHKP